MQRDFLEPGGFGETLGNNVSLLQAAVGPNRAVLDKLRELGLTIIHTREGHLPRSVRRASRQGGTRQPIIADRLARPHGAHPDPR